MHMYDAVETLGLSMEIFKYEYNLSTYMCVHVCRKNIKKNKPIYPGTCSIWITLIAYCLKIL